MDMSEAEKETDNQDIVEEFESGETPGSGADYEPEQAKDALETEESAVEEEELGPLEAALRDAAMWREVALRSKAELENFRKRTARERSDAARYANIDLLETLLPVLDNFEFGLQAAKAEEGSSIYLGMQMVLKQIRDFLSGQGVEVIDAVGQTFDPKLHNAVAQEASDEVPEGTVVSQVRKGYRMHERLLRPASVNVSTGPAVADVAVADAELAEGEAQPS